MVALEAYDGEDGKEEEVDDGLRWARWWRRVSGKEEDSVMAWRRNPLLGVMGGGGRAATVEWMKLGWRRRRCRC